MVCQFVCESGGEQLTGPSFLHIDGYFLWVKHSEGESSDRRQDMSC